MLLSTKVHAMKDKVEDKILKVYETSFPSKLANVQPACQPLKRVQRPAQKGWCRLCGAGQRPRSGARIYGACAVRWWQVQWCCDGSAVAAPHIVAHKQRTCCIHICSAGQPAVFAVKDAVAVALQSDGRHPQRALNVDELVKVEAGNTRSRGYLPVRL
jgi:hypothetical protein